MHEFIFLLKINPKAGIIMHMMNKLKMWISYGKFKIID
jgi:hypothetical protein